MNDRQAFLIWKSCRETCVGLARAVPLTRPAARAHYVAQAREANRNVINALRAMKG